MTDQPALIPERERFEAAKTPRNYLYWLNAYANGQGRQPDELHALCSYGHTVILGQQSEIDRLRADLATAREALKAVTVHADRAGVLIAQEALDRIGEQ